MKRIDSTSRISLLLSAFFLSLANVTIGQTNIALTAIATHSGGGVSASGYGPELYNNNFIPAPNTVGTFQWGWVSTNGWIEFTWPTAQSVGKVKMYKQNRPLTSCTLQYWNGTTYVNIMTYNSTTAPVIDSMVFTPVSTTKIRMNNCLASTSSSGNPNHGEIQIFGPNIPNDLSAASFASPVNNNQYCYNSTLPVQVIVTNTGSQPQSNFSVGATYTGPSSGNLIGTYIGTLAPQVSDTVDFGILSLQPGTYSIYSYTLLPTDTATSNDTSSVINFTIKAPVAVPQAFSDTVCLGGNAFVYVNPLSGATYNWYSASSAGTLVNTGNSVAFPGLTKDTTMYVSTMLNGCPSGRVPITAAVGNAPIVDLGNDTSFCESIPLILDAGNPGGTYMWSNGDTTQSILLTNQSGTYWVVVDKYCISSDTVTVNISPKADVSGISYVRMDNTYYFTTSNAQNVTNYLWIFGDGATSTLPNPTHTYAQSVNVELMVKLVVSNTCGTDTVSRKVPTLVNDVNHKRGVSIFPNPANSRVTIKSEKAEVKEISILNAMGAVVLRKPAQGFSGSDELVIESLPNGNYIVRILIDQGVVHLPLQVLQ